MTKADNAFTGLFALNDAKLTASQRNRCLTLYALQDDPFGMFSQWLYSRSLERENSHYQTISEQKKEIEHVNAFKETLLSEIDEANSFKDSLLSELEKMNNIARQKEEQTNTLEQVLIDEVSKLKSDIDKTTPEDRNLKAIIQQLEEDNLMLRQTLIQAVIEIEKLITRSN